MQEDFLHFIWKLQLFSSKSLLSTADEKIEVIDQGFHNKDSGPDFKNAKIRISEQLWAGNIEIHTKSSQWYEHKHQEDQNYDAVILHVVWEEDVEVFSPNNEPLPTLELKSFVSDEYLKKHQKLFEAPKKWIYCENEIAKVSDFKVKHFLEQLFFERLSRKSNAIFKELDDCCNHWEEVLFRLLLKNFGLKVNGDSFYQLAKNIDFSVFRKVCNTQIQSEAMLFGVADMLGKDKESTYFKELKREYSYLQKKFRIAHKLVPEIHFFRLRPSNFPTIRLSQVSQLYYRENQLFSKIIEIENLEDYYSLFDVSTSTYWQNHYTFDKESKKSVKKLSKSFIDLLIINTVIPIKFAYFQQVGKPADSLLDLMQEIKPESNTIVSNFGKLNINAKSAFETQSLIQLKNEYCNQSNCLNCTIGKELLTN